MKERGIIMAASSVRGILDGTKTLTRRLAKLNAAGRVRRGKKNWHVDDPHAVLACPLGVRGDRLFVKEAWAHARGGIGCSMYRSVATDAPTIAYRADGALVGESFAWKPSLFMPRWASRITLEIADVRVQRVHDISEEDAIAEGVRSLPEPGEAEFDRKVCPRCGGTGLYDGLCPGTLGVLPDIDCTVCDTFVKRYSMLWNSINGKRAPWSSNPWVWVIAFKRVDGAA